jgi:hypothetical protein
MAGLVEPRVNESSQEVKGWPTGDSVRLWRATHLRLHAHILMVIMKTSPGLAARTVGRVFARPRKLPARVVFDARF